MEINCNNGVRKYQNKTNYIEEIIFNYALIERILEPKSKRKYSFIALNQNNLKKKIFSNKMSSKNMLDESYFTCDFNVIIVHEKDKNGGITPGKALIPILLRINWIKYIEEYLDRINYIEKNYFYSDLTDDTIIFTTVGKYIFVVSNQNDLKEDLWNEMPRLQTEFEEYNYSCDLTARKAYGKYCDIVLMKIQNIIPYNRKERVFKKKKE